MVTDGSIEQSGFDLSFTTVQSKQYFRCVQGRQRQIRRQKTGLKSGRWAPDKSQLLYYSHPFAMTVDILGWPEIAEKNGHVTER
jgi:hypothetical protein